MESRTWECANNIANPMTRVMGFFGVVLMLLSGTLVYARRDEPEQWIAFISDRDGNAEIYRMRPDGSDVQQLTQTNDDVSNCWLEWSPKGTWLYYRWTPPVQEQIGEGLICEGGLVPTYLRISRSSLEVEQMLSGIRIGSQSPDERWFIGTEYDYLNQNYELYLYPSTTGEKRFFAFGHEPIWSPDSRWVNFWHEGAQIAVMSVDGKVVKDFPADDYGYLLEGAQSWSKDSESIIFNGKLRSKDENAPIGLYKLNINDGGIEMVQIDTGEIDGFYTKLALSPDGRWIAYLNLARELVVLDSSNGDFEAISEYNSIFNGVDFSWSPDSEWLVFTKFDAEGHSRIFRIRRDGTGLEQLTFGPGEDLRPAWSPVIDKAWDGWELMGIGAGLMVLRIPVSWARRNKTNGIS